MIDIVKIDKGVSEQSVRLHYYVLQIIFLINIIMYIELYLHARYTHDGGRIFPDIKCHHTLYGSFGCSRNIV
jgi:hypothetical protein